MDRRDSTIGGPRLIRRGDIFSSQESLNSLLRPSSQEVLIFPINLQELPQDNFLDIDAWKILDDYIPNDINTIQANVVKHLEYTLAKNKFTFDKKDCYFATGYSIRDRLIESFNDTQM